MNDVQGYSSPLSPRGESGLVARPPWHYAGDALVIEGWADPAAVEAVLPAPLKPHPDAGRMAAMFLDWQSCSDDGDELLDPSRAQYREFMLMLGATLDGEEVVYCPYIWVEKDFAMERGRIQGFPKELASVHMTRTYGLAGKADPGIRPGAKYAATAAAYDRRLADAVVELEKVSETGSTHLAAPTVGLRHFPSIGLDKLDHPAVDEIVRLTTYDRVQSEVWEGPAELNLYPHPRKEFSALAPVRMGKGFRLSFAWSVVNVDTVVDRLA